MTSRPCVLLAYVLQLIELVAGESPSGVVVLALSVDTYPFSPLGSCHHLPVEADGGGDLADVTAQSPYISCAFVRDGGTRGLNVSGLSAGLLEVGPNEGTDWTKRDGLGPTG